MFLHTCTCTGMWYFIDHLTITVIRLDSTMYQKRFYYLAVKLMLEQSNIVRAVTKISSCLVNITSRQGIKTARDFFWFYFSSIFL